MFYVTAWGREGVTFSDMSGSLDSEAPPTPIWLHYFFQTSWCDRDREVLQCFRAREPCCWLNTVSRHRRPENHHNHHILNHTTHSVDKVLALGPLTHNSKSSPGHEAPPPLPCTHAWPSLALSPAACPYLQQLVQRPSCCCTCCCICCCCCRRDQSKRLHHPEAQRCSLCPGELGLW